eukprot:390761-Pleurochrysis_carterae.AAC.1
MLVRQGVNRLEPDVIVHDDEGVATTTIDRRMEWPRNVDMYESPWVRGECKGRRCTVGASSLLPRKRRKPAGRRVAGCEGRRWCTP